MILLRELKHSKVYLYLGNLESLAHTHGKMHIQNKLENIPIFTPLANLQNKGMQEMKAKADVNSLTKH